MQIETCMMHFLTYFMYTQDGGASNLGKVIKSLGYDKWICVQWDKGIIVRYRMGAENCYDLQLAGNWYVATNKF